LPAEVAIGNENKVVPRMENSPLLTAGGVFLLHI